MWTNLVKRLPWPNFLILLSLAVLLLWIWHRGYESGHRDAQRDGDTALAQLQKTVSDRQTKERERQLAALAAMQQKYQQAQAQIVSHEQIYLHKLGQLEATNADLKKRIDSVTRIWRDKKGQTHPVSCVYTAGFVQQYNAAFGAASTPAATAAAPAGTAAARLSSADARLRDPLRNSGVSQRDLLANATDNALICQRLREQVIGLHSYIRALRAQYEEEKK